jgi:3-oxoacyl-[acyl-carrier protein] reductase
VREVSRRRAAVVTGGARGIGAGIAVSLLDAGWSVVVTDISGPDLEAFGAEHASVANRLELVHADVSSQDNWDDVVLAASRRFDGIDVLVNNAAISPKHDGAKLRTADVPVAEWQQVLDVNLTGAFLGIRVVLGPMVERGWGRIVNISSQAAHTGARVAGVHYGATKAAMLGLTRTVAHEYGPHGVTVNAITPGRIETPMAAGVADEVNQAMLATIPVGRLGQPDDVGAVVAFLASDGAGFITGATIDVNGGSRMG